MWRQTGVKKVIYIHKSTVFLLFLGKFGGSKAFVATNVATERIWLDTTALEEVLQL